VTVHLIARRISVAGARISTVTVIPQFEIGSALTLGLIVALVSAPNSRHRSCDIAPAVAPLLHGDSLIERDRILRLKSRETWRSAKRR
jgi:hypothetical protein